MSSAEVNLLLVEMDQWAASGHWQVHPWASLTSRHFVGRFLNIGVNGERLSRAPSTEHEGQPPLVVWFFGGSTSFGWGLSDDYTPPSQLQVALQNLVPDRQVQVVNFAVPIYASSQELALFIANLRRQKPDIAVFLDGVNDVWFPMYADNPTPLTDPLAGAWEARIAQIIAPASQPWLTFNVSFPPYRLARQLGIDISRLQVQPRYGVNYAMQGTGATTPDEQLQFVIDQYRANRRMATVIGQEFGVATFFFLQPWRDQFYTAFRENLIANNDHDHFFDVTDAFAQVDTSQYNLLVDDLHYSDYASKVLAERMAQLIVENYSLSGVS
jgi:lysophospholipase L1-like esterase